MLTQQRLIIRILGFSKQVEVMVNAAVYATGNNLTIANDMTDRTLLCSLDAGCERPGARHFDFDVIEDIHSGRERLVVAALTVLRAWHVAGVSQQVDPIGGFEDWSRRVREALIWLGRTDPCGSQATVYARDPRRAEFEAVVRHSEPHLLVGSRHTVQELINAARIDSNLHTALMAVAANRSGPMVSNERLGRWLRRHEGWIHGNLKLVRAGNSIWTLKRV
jgi:putative DNA primase/helicase